MPQRPAVYLIGAGGHAKVVADMLIEGGHPPAAFLDEAPRHNSVLGISVITGLEIPTPGAAVIIAVGDNDVRAQLAARFTDFAVAVHPSARVSRDAEIGPGTVIMAGAIVNPGARIGAHCIINTHASVDHDCLIGDFAHIAPSATLGGTVRVGTGALVGLGANVIHGRTIGDHAVIGAGSTVVHDIPANAVAIGAPARVTRHRRAGDPYL